MKTYNFPKINQPALIKIAAVITASPRWVIALLAAEGFLLPEGWRVWWLPLSALLNLGMAIIEGLAFSYMLTAWRNQKDKNSDRLFYMALFSALVFIAVMSPSIAAGVRGIPLSALLSQDWALYAWSISVSLSTIVIVAGVGYAEKSSEVNENEITKRAKEEVKQAKEEVKRAEAQAKTQETRLKETINAQNLEITGLKESLEQVNSRVGALSGLFSEMKKEQILAISQRWPKLSNNTIAEMVDTTASHVSNTLKTQRNGSEPVNK